jgi:hypothetical protein
LLQLQAQATEKVASQMLLLHLMQLVLLQACSLPLALLLLLVQAEQQTQ